MSSLLVTPGGITVQARYCANSEYLILSRAEVQLGRSLSIESRALAPEESGVKIPDRTMLFVGTEESV